MKNRQNKIIGLGIFACALCCLLPIAGSVVGLTMLATLTPWLEITSVIIIGIAVVGLLISYVQKKSTNKNCSTNCSTDCGCSSVNIVTDDKADISHA